VKFQVVLWDHVFDDLVRLGKHDHCSYRQQASYLLEHAVAQAMQAHDLDTSHTEDHDHATAP
jgi:hypothetical protein